MIELKITEFAVKNSHSLNHSLCPDITDIWFMYRCSVLILRTYYLCTVALSWYYGHMIYVHCSVLILPIYHSCTFVLFCLDITDTWYRSLCSIICLYFLSSVLWCPLRCMHKTVRLYLQLFVGGLMSYLYYLCVLHILVSSTSWIYD